MPSNEANLTGKQRKETGFAPVNLLGKYTPSSTLDRTLLPFKPKVADLLQQPQSKRRKLLASN